jgi:hypothetical protein
MSDTDVAHLIGQLLNTAKRDTRIHIRGSRSVTQTDDACGGATQTHTLARLQYNVREAGLRLHHDADRRDLEQVALLPADDVAGTHIFEKDCPHLFPLLPVSVKEAASPSW